MNGRLYFLVFITLFLFGGVLAQNGPVKISQSTSIQKRSITGKVLTEKEQPIQSVTVYIQNTSIVTQTNANGEFVLTNVPNGDFSVVAHHISYETILLNVKDMPVNGFIIRLKSKMNELETVVIRDYEINGWRKWGTIFRENFIGTSAYAYNCKILNQNVIKFVYSQKQNELRAYADEDLIIENRSLGYTIELELETFILNLSKEEGAGGVTYAVNSFFKDMEGNAREKERWKRNRLETYYGSPMHFMRSLYSQDYGKEGFKIREILPSDKPGKDDERIEKEEQRVKGIYQVWYEEFGDELKKKGLGIQEVADFFEKSLHADSLKYYRELLGKKNSWDNIVEPFYLPFKKIAFVKDSSTVSLNFRNYLQIIYTMKAEPVEYADFRRGVKKSDAWSPEFQNSVIYLMQGIPIDISQSGYYRNIDLFLDGYWGWFEKIATKLPYDYAP